MSDEAASPRSTEQELIAVRREKLAKLRELGVNPYGGTETKPVLVFANERRKIGLVVDGGDVGMALAKRQPALGDHRAGGFDDFVAKFDRATLMTAADKTMSCVEEEAAA